MSIEEQPYYTVACNNPACSEIYVGTDVPKDWLGLGAKLLDPKAKWHRDMTFHSLPCAVEWLRITYADTNEIDANVVVRAQIDDLGPVDTTSQTVVAAAAPRPATSNPFAKREVTKDGRRAYEDGVLKHL